MRWEQEEEHANWLVLCERFKLMCRGTKPLSGGEACRVVEHGDSLPLSSTFTGALRLNERIVVQVIKHTVLGPQVMALPARAEQA